MQPTSKQVKRTFYTLTLLSTLSASLIWGVNTLFLLEAGLSNTAAFAANAFFTVGQVLFEVPTGIVADTRGRKTSYMLGVITLLVTTLIYWWLWQIHGPFWAWALDSVLLGLGFTFFSGATEAWLTDALKFTNYDGPLEGVFAHGQAFAGVAMLIGSVLGGFLADATNLGAPYIARAALLGITLIVALVTMRDLGFTPEKKSADQYSTWAHMRSIFSSAVEKGFKNRPVRWMLLSAPFTGVSIYIFYAMQPHLLNLWGNQEAYSVAGLAAAIVAGAQIAGGLLVNKVRNIFKKRTTLLIIAFSASVAAVALLGVVQNFWVAIALLAVWGLVFSFTNPIRLAYINSLIDSRERATVISFDSMMNSAGGALAQPGLGRIADIWSYGTSYIASAVIELGTIPFLLLARREKSPADEIQK